MEGALADEGIPGGLRMTDRWFAAKAESGRRMKKRCGVGGVMEKACILWCRACLLCLVSHLLACFLSYSLSLQHAHKKTDTHFWHKRISKSSSDENAQWHPIQLLHLNPILFQLKCKLLNIDIYKMCACVYYILNLLTYWSNSQFWHCFISRLCCIVHSLCWLTFTASSVYVLKDCTDKAEVKKFPSPPGLSVHHAQQLYDGKSLDAPAEKKDTACWWEQKKEVLREGSA